MFYEDIRTKQDLSYISICSLSILYNSEFILMATSLKTNAVIVMKFTVLMISVSDEMIEYHFTVTNNVFTQHIYSFLFFLFGFYGPFKNISLILSQSFIKGGQKPENPGKNHLTIHKQNLAFPHMTRARLKPQWCNTFILTFH